MDIFTWRPYGSSITGKCGLEVYQKGQESVVIATELADNPGESIRNGFEELIAHVAIAYQLTKRQITWLDASADSDDLNVVSFQLHGSIAASPCWACLPPALFSKEAIVQRMLANGYKVNNLIRFANVQPKK